MDPDLTLKKATDLARQSEAVKKQQTLLRSNFNDDNSSADSAEAAAIHARKQHGQKKPQSTYHKPGTARPRPPGSGQQKQWQSQHFRYQMWQMWKDARPQQTELSSGRVALQQVQSHWTLGSHVQS